MDIISLLFELLKGQKIERYRLAIIASQRARALVDGARPLIETKNIKPTTIALEEVLQGKIEFLTGKEARIAQKEHKETRRTRLKGSHGVEDNHLEIKKDLSIYLEESREKTKDQEETV
jgi:DNA-directed RNA polymerase subunit omega